MVRKESLGILRIMTIIVVLGALLCSPAYSQDRDEVIIEGQDRSPSGSVTEYGDGDQSGESTGSKTTDKPTPSVDRTIEEPELDREIKTGSDTETQETGTILRSDSSYKWLWGIAIGVGILVIAL